MTTPKPPTDTPDHTGTGTAMENYATDSILAFFAHYSPHPAMESLQAALLSAVAAPKVAPAANVKETP